jgi:magnesium transporter
MKRKQQIRETHEMIFNVDDGELIESEASSLQINEAEPYLCIFNKEELRANAKMLKVNDRTVKECIEGNTFKFESHEGFDFIALNIPWDKESLIALKHISIYFRPNMLIFVSNHLEVLPIVEEIQTEIEETSGEMKDLSLQKILYLFLDNLTKTDSNKLELMEERILKLEEAIITSRNKNFIAEIIKLRKKLLTYKRYYDRLLSISESVEENMNGLLNKKEMRHFRLLTDRTRRLLESTRYLQDYLSQIREAYQTQVDINLNSIMKLSTVITTIFLPLTLIVGWYGMNLQMPEYHWSFGYPLLITLSLIISVLIIIYFKKHKWF